jgi:hypothetical protein
MPYSLLDQLNAYAEKTGLSKTEVVVRAIASYLQQGDSLGQKLNQVEQRLSKVETMLKLN